MSQAHKEGFIMKRPNRFGIAIIMAIVAIVGTIGIASANSSGIKLAHPAAVNQTEALSASDNASADVSPASSCTRRSDIIPQPNVWKHVRYTSSRRLLNFWTNSPGHSQRSYKVKIGKGVNIDILGGGSLWTCPDQDSWNSGYSHNPLPGRTVSWLISQGLARRI